MVLVRLTKSRNYHCIILGIFLVVGEYSCNCTPITITRANDSFDVFTTPRINCKAFCSVKKSLVLRNTSRSCACKCGFNASTFVFNGDLTSSVCMDNINIRSTLGQCELLLDGNNKSSSLPVLDISISGSMVFTGQGIGPSACSVLQEYFLDNGTWVVGASGNLTIFRTDQNLLKWSGNPSVSSYTGRIVKVHIQCHVNTSCVMIKIQGHISYNVLTPVISTSIALHPSPTTRYVRSAHPTTSTNHGTSSLQFTRSKTKNVIPMKPETISPTLATVVTVTSSAVVIPNGETKAVQDGCERGTWVFCHWFYLVTAALGVVVLLAVLIILISCVCIRRRRRSLRHQKPVFFKSGLTHLKETDSSTELALIEMDVKPANEDHKEQNNEEAFYQNVPRREKPDKNQPYRPLRSSDGRDSPASPGRFSFGSSTNEVMLYDDTTDSNKLIKRESGSQSSISAGQRFRTFCPSPVVVQSKKEFLSSEAVLDAEEEATYEIMETKTLPHNSKINPSDIESITGYDNQVFEEDDHRQSHYEAVSDEQPNYENLEENQPNYERMEKHRSGLGLNTQNEEESCSGLDEEQENYETMDTLSGEEQPDYEIMEQNDKPGEQNSSLFYKKMGAHKDWHSSSHDSGNEEIEVEREYDIPVITEDEHESHYDIPELSLEVSQDPDNPDYHYAVNTENHNTGLAVPNNLKHDNDDDEEEEEEDYVYANVPDIQANDLREKLRNSWHSGEQQHVEEATGKRDDQTQTAKQRADKRPSSWNTSTAGQNNEKTLHEDDEELYSLPDNYSKPLPSCLLKGTSSPQLKQTQAKNQVPTKQKQRSDNLNCARQANDQIQPKDDVVPSRAHLGPKTIKPVAKNNVALSNMLKKNKSSLEQPALSTNEEKQERRRRQTTSGKKQANDEPRKLEEYNQNSRWYHEGNKNKATENAHTYEQPLYTNLVEMENEGQTLANENNDVQTEKDFAVDQQPLYENVGAMVGHVG